MKYNRINLLATKFAAKGGRNELETVLFLGDRTVASNSYMLCEIMNMEAADPGFKPLLIPAKSLKVVQPDDGIFELQRVGDTDVATVKQVIDERDVDSLIEVSEGTFPKYEAAFPKGKATRLMFNPEFIEQAAKTMRQAGVIDMKMDFYGENNPIVMTGKAKTGQGLTILVMPVRIDPDKQ